MPMDRRLPRVRVRTRRGDSLVGARFLCRLDGWPASAHYPAAHLVRVLGGLGDLQCAPAPPQVPPSAPTND